MLSLKLNKNLGKVKIERDVHMRNVRKKLINKIENEKGAITALVLASLLVITIILINLYIMGSNKSNSQNKEIKTIQEAYNYTEDKIDLKYKNSIVFEHINTANTNPKEALPSNIKEIVENDANKGIVIKDKNENEWVWVEVPRATVFAGLTIDTTTELTEQNYNNIKDKLITYAGVYRNGSDSQNRNDWIDEWYAMDGDTLVTASTSNLTDKQKALTNGCGLTYDEYKKTYQKMLKSVYEYGGFWIGRYEAGIEGTTTETTNARTSSSGRISIETSPKAISQKDAIPYNWIYCSEAQALAKEMTPNSNYTSSLMFGIQWDLVCKYLEVKSTLETSDINSNSTSWGNYSNVGRTISSDKAKQTTNSGSTWTAITGTKPASIVLLTTGASEETNKMNIYDFAGNEWEWILEKSSFSNYPCADRGGDCYNYGSYRPASYRSNDNTTNAYSIIGFRPALYAN